MTPRNSLIAAALCLQFCPLSIAQADSGFVPLFDGQTLDGWVNVNCAPSTWSARDGVIYCTGRPIGELRTERMYQNFILKLQWRHLRPKGNAGVFVWADAITAPGQTKTQAEPGFVPLFDGKTLDGWVNVNCAPSTWAARDGVGAMHRAQNPTATNRLLKKLA